MSLIDLASLVLAPTATKEGKVYSAIPDTGEGDMTFTRGSAATRVNSAGLIEKERGNLLLQSNSFDTTWSSVLTANVVGGQSGYDGSSDAWTLETQSGQASRRAQNLSGLESVNSFSVYAKANTLDWMRLQISTASGNYVGDFDLTNGVSGYNFGDPLPSIESVGNGWYRVKISGFNVPTQVRIYALSGNNDFSGAGTIFIQDAMLNQGLVAQSYIETTTTAVYEGITDDVPRVDYSGGGCPSLKLEPQRSNLAVHSEYFEASNWTALRSTIALSSSTSPEGVLNAYKLTTDNTTNNTHIIYYGGTLSTDDYALSVYAKAGEFSKVGLGTGNLTLSAKFDLSNGSIITSGTHTASIEDAGNGWYRCSIVTTTTTPIRIVLLDDDGNISFDGDGTSGLYIYGHQCEAGSYSTSYLPTYGTSTTRVQDSCYKTGISSLLNPSEGAVFLEINTFDNGTTSKVFTIGDGTGNRIQVFYYEDSIRLNFTSGGTSYAYFNHALTDVNDTIKMAVSYANNDIRMYVNGVLTNSDTSATMPSTLSYARFDNGSGGSLFYGNIKQSLIFPTALTNDELAELTKL